MVFPLFSLLILLVGIDDSLHKRMPYYVFTGQLRKGDSFHIFQDKHGIFQTGTLSLFQILLRKVSCHNHLRAEADSCQEHLHLRRSGILRLIEDDISVVQCSSSHIRKRSHFNESLLGICKVLLRPHDVIESVIKRPKIRIHLRLQVTR